MSARCRRRMTGGTSHLPSSRLGCQLVITSELEGLLLHLPAGANNIMDNIPFQDAR